MFFNTLKKLFSSTSDKKIKNDAEISYWRGTKEKEGELSNAHYQYFFTEHFSLTYEFYKGKRVLDIGCGPRGSLEWADNALERVGLDPLADEYASLGASHHKMRYCPSGSEAIPYPDNYFDVITTFNSLDHVDDLEKTILEIKRIARKEGSLLLLSDLNHEPTICEPTCFSWDVASLFAPEFRVLEEKHYEAFDGGIYDSILKNVPYDHDNPAHRAGIISVKLGKIL